MAEITGRSLRLDWGLCGLAVGASGGRWKTMGRRRPWISEVGMETGRVTN